ncbi:MAG: ParB N-terminal domain-containing protein [Candidatus Bathyarchaeia archaeon]
MTSTTLTEKSKPKIAVLPIDSLKPHEKGSPLYLEILKQEITRDNVLKYPIVADERTRVILDGMHRWLALKNLGYTLIPVMLVDAHQNPRIRVGKRRIHRYICASEEEIPIETVVSAGLSGNLMKTRSTRHFFPFSKFYQINYPLRRLKRDKPQDVSKYLEKMTLEDCKKAIKEWLEEMIEELDFLTKRKEEVEKEVGDFLSRVKGVNNFLSH